MSDFLIQDGVSSNAVKVIHKLGEGDEFWYLLTSDRHWDNPKSDHFLQKRHLDEIKRKNGKVIDIGDFFCAMQGKGDPRGNKDDLRPEHQTSMYLDSLVNTAVDWFSPYADNFLVIGEGNHETAVKKHRETDLRMRLVNGLNMKNNSTIRIGGYGGWVRFCFCKDDFNEIDKKVDLYYHHGHGGGGPVTKGTIQAQRRSSAYDADIFISGHIHESWFLENNKVYLDDDEKVSPRKERHVCLKTYKEEYGDGSKGFHIEKGRQFKSVGCWWLKFYRDRGDIKFDMLSSDD